MRDATCVAAHDFARRETKLATPTVPALRAMVPL
jgi:hypothetical protein